jgi:outer membrane protein TolC
MKRISPFFLCLAILLIHVQFGLKLWGDEKDDSKLELTLDAFIIDVVRYNPLVEEARLRWLISFRNAGAAWGDFEPEIVGSYEKSELQRENTAQQMFAQGFRPEFTEENEEYSVGVEGKIISGGTYRIGYSVNKIENNLSESPEYKSFAGVSGEQPLLKGATHGAPLAVIRTAQRDFSIALHNYRKRLMITISDAEAAYWNFVFAQGKYHLATDSVGMARNFVKDAEERVKAGKMSELDLREVEAGLAIRLSHQSDSEQNVRDAETQLKLLLSQGIYDETQEIVAVDPLVFQPKKQDQKEERDASVEWALRAQPDYIILWEELEKQRIALGVRLDQRLPELNINGSYGLNGLGETVSESLSKLETRAFPAWSVGLEMRIPLLFGIRERNELAAARMERELAEKRLESAEYEIAKSINTLIQRIETLRKRMENIRTVVDYNEYLLDVELSRLDAGKSNSRIIYEAEEELRKSREAELEHMLRYREAVMQLALTRGSVLHEKELEQRENDQIFLSDSLTFIDDEM